MKRTFQALAITTVIVAIVSFCSIILYWHTSAGEWLTFHPAHPQYNLSSVQSRLLVVWSAINDTLWAPIVAVFAVVVAAQARRWGWLAALSIVGLLAILGPQILFGLPLGNMGLLGNPVIALLVRMPFGLAEYTLAAILYAAALVFAAVELRGQSGAAASASVSPAPQL
ncbi:MAG TPA: hypothetical protein VF792_10325 [Ktedonobacterales bacterium]